MRYRKLTVENFGPYKDKQVLDFSRPQGVWIVYGSNGRGKTTLLNAFRFAMYGTVEGRSGPADPERLINSIAVSTSPADEATQLSVTLEFEHEGHDYELTRTCSQGGDTTLTLQQDGEMLSLDESEATLRSLAPPSVSQFFLFDGELLSQYEQLTDSDSDAAKKLRQEVDRILGVTSILRTREDLRAILADENKELAKAAQADKETERLGKQLSQLNDKRAKTQELIGEARDALEGDRDRLEDIEDKLDRHTASQQVMGRLDALKGRRTELRAQILAAEARLREVTPHAWEACLAAALPALEEQVQGRIDELDERRIEAHAHQYAASRLRHGNDCPTCRRGLDDAERDRALEHVEARATREDVEALDDEVSRLREKTKLLHEVREAGAKAAIIAERERGLRGHQLELRGVKEEINECEDELAGIDQSAVRKLQQERSNLQRLISEGEERIEELSISVEELDEQAGQIRREIEGSGTGIDPVLQRRVDLTQTLAALIDRSVDEYRQQVLNEVESHATKLFTGMRAEEEFARLEISEGYGLRIVNEQGEPIAAPSAGYAHLVALSLIGALQRSSPVQGPIVIDSPTGRLDRYHRRTVVEMLPEITDQVVLLAFEDEFDHQEAVDDLGTALVGVYDLERRSAEHTELTRRTSRV